MTREGERLEALLASGTAIAIVGMAGRFPGAANPRGLWQNVRDGVESIRTLSEAELDAAGVPRAVREDPAFVPVSALLDGVDRFDAKFFGFSPRDAAILDPQHRHFLETAWEALEDAGRVPERFPGPIGVFAGSGANAYLWANLLTNPDLAREVGFFLLRHTGNDKDFLATRASYALNLTGPSVNVQTACSTSLVAVHMAAQSLLSGECDMALAGGVSIEHPHGVGYRYREGEILSPDGRCRAFDAAAAGTVFGSGVGVVVLRRLEDALAQQDAIHAVLLGSAVNNDGSSKVGYLAPSVEGQARAIAEALGVSGVSPDTLGYVEAHGTGTAVGDPIEVAALTQAFRTGTGRREYCALGSVKPNIGHLDTAAGVAGLVKTVFALKEGLLPPTLHFRAPNPDLELESSPFYVSAEPAPWTTEGPRRAGVASLGVGGTNAFAVLEEAPDRPARAEVDDPPRTVHLLPLAARTRSALEAASADLGRFLEEEGGPPLADVAFTLAVGRRPFAHRRAVLASCPEEAVDALATADPERIHTGEAAQSPPSVSFLFGGGGSQYPGMGAGLYREEPVYRRVVDECLALLAPEVAADVRELLLGEDASARPGERGPGREARFERPGVALPALFITQLAQARLWRAWGVEPAAMIGHSMGEYTAACLSGVFSVPDALRLVTVRGRLFERLPRGGMLGVNLAEGDLASRLPRGLSIAAVNGPELSVASGPIPLLEELEAGLAADGVECRRIHIAVAAHSAMLDPVLEEFRAVVERLERSSPRVPFVSNLSGDWIDEADARDPDYWVRHLRQTVRFAEGAARLVEERPGVLLEVGPGRTLATLVRTAPGSAACDVLTSMAHPHPDRPGEARGDLAFQLSTLGRLWTLGVGVDWDGVHRDRDVRRVSLPTYPFERERHWISPGTGIPLAPDDADETAAEGPAADGSESAAPPSGEAEEEAGAGPFYRRGWIEAAPEPPPGPREAASGDRGAAVLVVGDGSARPDRLLAELRREGEAVWVGFGSDYREEPDGGGNTAFGVRPGEVEDARRVLGRVREATGAPPRGIVYLSLLEGEEAPAGAEWDALPADALGRAFHGPVALLQALAEDESDDPFPFLVPATALVQVEEGDAPDPWKSLVLGPVRVAPREFPRVRTRSIDLPAGVAADAPQLAAILRRELREEEGGALVAYRGGRRLRETFRRTDIREEDGAADLDPNGSYLVTGGLGGIGLALARHLAARGARALILLGRTGLPPREAWDAHLARHPDDRTSRRIVAVREIEAGGCRVAAPGADVTDGAALARVVREAAERLGPIRGVVHAAGILDDAPILRKTSHDAERVLAPKVGGTIELERALAGQPLDFRVYFSSSSAFSGLPGQVDYTAANAFLDARAERAARAGGGSAGRVVSVQWDVWREVGMAVDLLRGGARAAAREALPDHPLFPAREREGAEVAYLATFRRGSHWMLDEHRLRDGAPLVPGAGFLELLRAAFELEHGPGPAVLRDVLFLEPFVVPEGTARRMRVRLRRSGEGLDAAILGRPDEGGEWTEHVRARMEPLGRSVRAGPAGRPLLEASAGWSRREVGGAPPNPRLHFGPRWANLTEVRTSGSDGDRAREAVLALELPAGFEGDPERHPLHPALADVALAGAQALIPGFDAERDFFIPVSCSRFEVREALPARCFSHLRLRDGEVDGMAVFDVSILDEEGREVARAEEFVMLRLDDPGRLAGEGGAPAVREERAAPEAVLEEGLTTAEGLRAFDRLLGAPACPPVVAVVPRDLHALLAELDAPPAGPRREAGADMSPVVEALLEHPAVEEASAVAHDLSGDRLRVVAFVVYHPRASITVSELRRHLRERLPDALVPRNFVEMARLPRTAAGAVDRAALPDPFAPKDEHVAPRTPTERAIVEVWSRLLGTDRIGVHDNFLDVGGHSLVGIRALVQIEKRTGVRLDPNALTLQTVEQLAAEIDRRRGNGAGQEERPQGLAGRILDAVRGRS